jgi:DNA-binding Lrp family transcriptional regulator
MMTKQKYQKELERLRARLDVPRSARQLARLLRCSLPAVYDRIAVLQRSGVAIRLGSARVGKRGPLSTTFVESGGA